MTMLLTLALLASIQAVPRLSEHVDPLTDERSVYLVIGNATANVALGCSNTADIDTVRVVAHFDKYVGDATPGILAGGRDLLYRFDRRPARSVLWYAHGHDVFAESTPTKPLEFMREAKGSTLLNLRSTDPDGDQADMAFSYPDATSLIETVLVRCGFTVDGKKPKK
jgi:hypothetical protein